MEGAIQAQKDMIMKAIQKRETTVNNPPHQAALAVRIANKHKPHNN